MKLDQSYEEWIKEALLQARRDLSEAEGFRNFYDARARALNIQISNLERQNPRPTE